MSNDYYHRINANSNESFVEAQIHDFDADADDEYARLQSLLAHERAKVDGKWEACDDFLLVEIQKLTMWCNDGKARELTVFMDENGRGKSLLPNHRANALIDAGRFTTKDREEFKEGRNQSLKEHQGCSFVYGNVVCKIPFGGARPDHSVYGNNPLMYVTQPRAPSAKMIRNHGEELARNKLSPTKKMNTLSMLYSGRITWEDTSYHVVPKNCTNFEYKMLLKKWGVQDSDLDRLFGNVEAPPRYATALQYTREWAALDPADRVVIWSLPQTPCGQDSICWREDGTEVPLNSVFETVFHNKEKTPQRLQFIELMNTWESSNTPRMIFINLSQKKKQRGVSGKRSSGDSSYLIQTSLYMGSDETGDVQLENRVSNPCSKLVFIESKPICKLCPQCDN